MSGGEEVSRAEGSRSDMIMLDSGQGSGRAFDWGNVSRVHRPFILAGGLTSETIGKALTEVNPWGIDMSSGIETDKVKAPAIIATAVDEVRRWRL